MNDSFKKHYVQDLIKTIRFTNPSLIYGHIILFKSWHSESVGNIIIEFFSVFLILNIVLKKKHDKLFFFCLFLTIFTQY